MITNERRYRIAKAQLQCFDEALAAQSASKPTPNVDPRIHQALTDATASEIDELRSQLEDVKNRRPRADSATVGLSHSPTIPPEDER